MKKRILSMLLSVAMIFSMLPTMTLPAMATGGEHTPHCWCGDSLASTEGHNCDDAKNAEWKVYDPASDLNIMDDGYYYLTDDYVVTKYTAPEFYGEVYLCLNGHKLYGENDVAFELIAYDNLVLCDCQEGGHLENVCGGDDNTVSVYSGEYSSLAYFASINVYGGTITECIYEPQGQVNVYGGSIFNLYNCNNIYLSGSPVITGGVRGSNDEAAIHAPSNVVTIDPSFAGTGANAGKISVYLSSATPTEGKPVHFATVNSTNADEINRIAGLFTSHNSDDYIVTADTSTGNLFFAVKPTTADNFEVSILAMDAANDSKLPGAHLQLLDSEGNVIDEWDSTIKAHKVTSLAGNVTYTCKSTAAPVGYAVPNEFAIYIDENGEATVVGDNYDTENAMPAMKFSKTAVKISVVDAEDSSKLAGAHLQILDRESNVVKEWDSTTDVHEVTGLTTGETYTLRGTVAANGYVVPADTTFTLYANGSIDESQTTAAVSEGVLLVKLTKAQLHTHAVCGATCNTDHAGDGINENHESVTWTALSSVLTYDADTDTYSGSLSVAGNYYLDKDITLSATLTISADVSLDLNGHKLALADSATGSVINQSSGTLNICDCNGGNGSWKFAEDSTTGLWTLSDSGTNTVTGGIITGGTGTVDDRYTYGGGIYAESKINMYSGTIVGNAAVSAGTTARGGGVYTTSIYNMYGGAIKGNASVVKSSDTYDYHFYSQGGGFCISGSSAALNMYGNSAVEANTAFVGQNTYEGTYGANNQSRAYGGGVYLSKADMNMYGNSKVSYNGLAYPAEQYYPYGGGIYINGNYSDKSELNLFDSSSIDHNDASDSGTGGGIHVVYGTEITLNDEAVIEYNNAAWGGGLTVGDYMYEDNLLTMNDKSKIQYNTAKSAAGVYVDGADFVMNGGEIIYNCATANGGGVYVNNAYDTGFTINAGTISYNEGVNGAGVFVSESQSSKYPEWYSESYLLIGGDKIRITDNKNGTNESNVYLQMSASSSTVYYQLLGFAEGVTTLHKDTLIGVTRYTDMGTGWPYLFSRGGTDFATHFYADNHPEYQIAATSDGSGLQMQDAVYKITVPTEMPEGAATIASSAETATSGTSITITVTPDSGYVVKSITVTCDDGTTTAPTVTLTGNNGTFTMPASDVTVEVEMQYQVSVNLSGYSGSDTITAVLYENGEKTDKTIALTKNSTSGTFDVDKYDADDEEITYSIMLADKVDGYNVKIEGTSPSFTIAATQAQNVTFEISDTEHIADGNAKAITIDSVAPNGLTADNFTVSYYLINENGDDETLFQPVIGTPTQVGKYVYVIDFNGDHSGYEFENEFHAEAGSTYYAWEASALPSETVTYSNAGIMTIEADGKDLGTMSFENSYVEVYADDSVENKLTDELVDGAEITYSSSNENIASVDADTGDVTISGVGTVTITATASLEGYADKTAQYVLKVNPNQYVITLADKTTTYGQAIPAGSAIKSVVLNGVDRADLISAFGTAFSSISSTYKVGDPVGKYTISGTIQNDATTNVYTVVPGTLTVTPKGLSVDDFTVSALDKPYDESTDATISAYVIGDTKVTALITGTFSDADAGEGKTVTYTITGVTGDGAGNYTVSADITGTTTATIDKATVAVTIAENTDVVYGNTPNVSVFAMANGKQFTDFTVSYAKDDAPVETGSLTVTNSPYDVVLTLGTDSAKNYEFDEYTATLTVLPVTGDFLVAAPSGTIYYGDTGLQLTHTDGWTAQYSVSGTAVIVDASGRITVNSVGTATITVTGSKANYKDVARTIELEVKPRPVSVMAVATNKVYNGTVNVEVILSLNDGVTRALTGLTLNTDNVTATVQDANVGTGKTVTVTGFTLSDSTNYTLISDIVTTTVNITPKEITQITFDAVDKKYDGNANADVENIALTGVLVADKDSVSVIGSATFDNADVATSKTVTFKNLTLNGAKSGNYTLNLTTEPTSTADITARPVVFTFGQTEFPYDGNPKTVNITAATDDGKVFTDFTAAYGGNLTGDKAINAGNYTITITLNNNNYTFQNSADASNKLTITAVDQNEMKIFGNPDDLYYGREFTLEAFGGNGNGAVTWSSNDTSVATVDQATGAVKIVGVGNVTITATKASDGNYNAQTAKIELTTTKREVTFTISDNVKIFDGSKQSVTVTPSVSGLVVGTDYTVTYVGDCTNVGTYKVTVTATGNYSGSAEGTLSINKGDLTITGFAVEDTTYGTKAVVKEPTLPDGVSGKVIFIVDGKETEEQPRNVGSYIAYYTATGDNYNTLELSDSFEIKQAVLTATASNASRQYGNGNPVFEITYSGFQYNEDESVINVKPTASSTASVTSPVGTYDITVSGGSDDNYTFDYVTGTLTITESDVEESKFVIDGPATATYGDTITLSAKYDGNSVNVTWSSSDAAVATIDANGAVTILKSGTVTFTATMDDSNYGEGTATLTVSISKLEIDIDVSNNVKPYNGQVQAPTFSSEDADLNDVTIEVTYTDAISGQAANPKEVGTYTVSYKVAETDECYTGSGTATFTITNGIPVDDDLDGNVDDDDYVYGSDEDSDGIYDGANGETYIPSEDVYVEVTGPDEDGIYDSEKDPDTDGFDDKYIPVDKDNDGDYDDSIVDKDGDGIFEDSEGNTYIPDQDGDGRPEPDTDGDGIFEGTDSENKYIPSGDNNGDGENDGYLTDSDGDGIYEDEDGNKYVPDQDGDDKPEKVTDTDGDGIYEDEDGNKYIPDQDGDGKPEKVTDADGDGIYEDEDGNKYIPDQDGDGKVEPDTNGDGIFEGSDEDKGETYIPVDSDGDGENDDIATDDNGDGLYEDDEGNKYIPSDDDDDNVIDGGTKVEDEDGDGIYEDEDGNEYKPDDSGNYNPYVATPVISPNGGTFSGSQSVTITTTTNGATIYYTTNGSEPSATNGTEYTGAISIRDTTTIKAIAVKNGVASGVVETTFTKQTYYPPIIIPTYYDITVNSSVNGDVSANRKTAASGTTITLTVDPDDGYELNTLSVTDRYGNAITVTAKTNDSYTFRMPSKDVWVTATFTKEAGTPDTPSVHICPSKEFSDVNTNLWYHEAIDFVLWNGYMNGMGNGQFQPGTALNRAMIVQVLYNMENRPDYKTVSSFEDVKSGDWFYDAINWAAENNIVNGYSDTEFGPLDPITREQMAAILYRYADYKGINVTARGDLSIFTDGNKTSAWALDEVRWAVKVGLISGKGNGVLDPTGTATRAEVAQILMNYCKKVLGE